MSATAEPPLAPVQRQPVPVPPKLTGQLRRGRETMKRNAARRRLCMRFERGDTFWWVDEKAKLNQTATVTTAAGGGKPPHKVRNTYNFIRPIIEEKVSAATQRIPNFEVDPSTNDPEDAGAAKMSEKTAIYGYDQWRMRAVAIDAVKTAIGLGGASYTMPYWQPNVGPYVQVDDDWIGQGDVELRVFNGNEVYWQSGVEFERSPWWATEVAVTSTRSASAPATSAGRWRPTRPSLTSRPTGRRRTTSSWSPTSTSARARSTRVGAG
jgi:hypothetical protein